MNIEEHIKDKRIICLHCVTGKMLEITVQDEEIIQVKETKKEKTPFFVGPGLIDLQINGINGIDFNNPSLSVEDIIIATQYVLSQGITSFFPTVITNSDENIVSILQTINAACTKGFLVNECIAGIHLEGPFISLKEGAKGAHDEKFIKAPDWDLFKKFQDAAGGKIKIITLAPEWEGAGSFIEKCRENGVLVSIGHSLANTKQIENAVAAGAMMSTHLGNAVPLLLPRHPNLIWDQLAADELYTCLIADGIHIPDSFMKTVIKVKGDKTIIISDATCFAGMPPGEYKSHIGGTVILDHEKRISLKGSSGLLAGAAKTLLENVETLTNHKLSTLGSSWKMASVNVEAMLTKNLGTFLIKNDLVIFQVQKGKIVIEKVFKNGRVVFEQ